jgi:hypothetical protein
MATVKGKPVVVFDGAETPKWVAGPEDRTVTVAVAAFVELQPFASVTTRLYAVVIEGAAFGEQEFGLSRPVDGAQEHEAPPDPESGADCPSRIVVDPEATAIGVGFTVTVALPDDVPGPLASEIEVTV